MNMLRLLILLIAFWGVADMDAAPKKKRTNNNVKKERTIPGVKKEQTDAEKKIKENDKKLKNNSIETNLKLNELSVLKSEIRLKSKEISLVKANIDSLNVGIRTASDSLERLEMVLTSVQQSYIKALRSLQGTQPMMDYLSYLFSSESFSKAYARMRYMSEFSRWRQRKINEIMHAKDMVGKQRNYLDSLNAEKRGSLVELNKKEQELKDKKRETDNVVNNLRKERKNLQAAIANQKKQMQQLENELKRLEKEEEERRKKAENKKGQTQNKNKSQGSYTAMSEADRKLSGGFEANRGKLLLPISGKYTVVRPFGTMSHPEIDHLETKNLGVDMLVADGTKVRCIYDGVVSGILYQNKTMCTVIIRHGEYRSIYQYVTNPSIKKGDKVITNQVIGTVAHNLDYSRRPVIHFEIRKGTTPLNPLEWAK